MEGGVRERRLFWFYCGRDWMRLSGYIIGVQIGCRGDIMGRQYGYPDDEGREVLCWLLLEVRIPWPLIRFRARSDAGEIRFREGVKAMLKEPKSTRHSTQIT